MAKSGNKMGGLSSPGLRRKPKPPPRPPKTKKVPMGGLSAPRKRK